MKKHLIHLIILLLTSGILFFTLLISPYRYEWEPVLKQVDDDAVLVLRCFCILLLLLNTIGLYVSALKKQKIIYLYSTVALFVAYKLAKTFFL